MTDCNLIKIGRLLDVSSYQVEVYEQLLNQVPLFEKRGNELLSYLRKLLDFGYVFVLEESGALKGLLGFYANNMQNREAYISILSVDQDLRGQGWGAKLLGRVLDVCWNSGMSSVALNVVKNNLRGIAFYKKFGFYVAGEGRDSSHWLMRLVRKKDAVVDSLERCCSDLLGTVPQAMAIAELIPCKETCSQMSLCKHPFVSVRIVTYNHESYIADCLNSVLAQKTDFEFEIVIGEDCSQDKTREICLAYQRRYPKTIRVLWSDENVYKIGGNVRRCDMRCRGEYIALLEGDDYWTDPLKLQKEVDLIRKTGAIACVANYQTKLADGTFSTTKYQNKTGFITHHDLARFYPHTSTYVIRRDAFRARANRFPNIHAWYDVISMHCLAEMGKIAFLPDVVSVYRITGGGIATSLSGQKKQLLAVKQYLDLYLHGPSSWHKRFGAAVMTYCAFFFNRSTPGWTKEFTHEHSAFLRGIFWTIFARQFYDLRSIRAFLRYVRFRLGLRR